MRFLVIFAAVCLATCTYADWAIQNLGSPPNSSAWEYRDSASSDGNKIFFNRDDGKIYVTTWNGNNWSTPTVLPPPINDPGATNPYWDSATNTLYFSGVFSGGYGGSDIWRSRWTGSSWEPRENLGSSVNTSANEYAGCIAETYFYFTRSGIIYVADISGNNFNNARLTGIGSGYPTSYHQGWLHFYDNRSGGYGGTDCWKVQGSGTSWGSPQNMGSQINTPSNEGGGSWATDGKYFYFDSGRSGGYGNEDLYRARYTEAAVSPASLGRIKAMFQ